MNINTKATAGEISGYFAAFISETINKYKKSYMYWKV